MRILLGLVLVAGLFAAVPNISNTRAYAEGSTINIEITAGAGAKTDDAYAPNPAQANVGDTVIWTNNDTTPHTATLGLPADPDGKFGGDATTGGVTFGNPIVNEDCGASFPIISAWENHVYIASDSSCIKVSHDNGTSFEDVVFLGGLPAKLVSKDNFVFLAGTDDVGNVEFRVSDDYGATFGNPITLNCNMDISNPTLDMSIAGEGDVYVT